MIPFILIWGAVHLILSDCPHQRYGIEEMQPILESVQKETQFCQRIHSVAHPIRTAFFYMNDVNEYLGPEFFVELV